jgi:hypothetical protein
MNGKIARRAACWGVLAVMLGALAAIPVWLPNATLAAGALIAAVLVAVTFWATFAWWQRLDETARDAHKTAWFWGGSAGLGVAAIVGITLTTSGAREAWRAFEAGAEPSVYILAGIMLCIVPQMIGYALFWAGWWLSKR